MNARTLTIALAIFAFTGTSSASESIKIESLHAQFTEAFNSRDWSALRTQMSDDIVFHRASGERVFIGPDAVIARFSETIGNQDQWNVKFATLHSDASFTGKDGRVVERGDFAVTAGGDSNSCYQGSYMMTWVNQANAGWRLQLLAWQDVETDIRNCQ